MFKLKISNNLFLLLLFTLIISCSTTIPNRKHKSSTYTSKIQKIRITNIDSEIASSELMLFTMNLIGTKYRFGGNSKSTGFDCSGLIVYVYNSVLGVKLPRTANDLAQAGTYVNKNQLKIGDLVFFNTTGNKYSHVGIYIGNGDFINSPNSNGVVRINNINEPYYAKRYSGGRTFFVK